MLYGPIHWWRSAAAMLVSLALQVGVNFANDYSDGVKGTDTNRVGPLRLVGSGLVPAGAVKRAAYASFAFAALVGFALAAVTTWWLIAVGLAAIVAAWTYTGGPRPYGYAGLGEVFVFVFFGVVATVGSEFVHRESIHAITVVLSVAAGLLAMSLLVVNNLRDIPGDTEVGKRTLAVRIGDAHTRTMYLGCLAAAFVCVMVAAAVWKTWPVLLGLLAALVAIAPVRLIRSGARSRDLIAVLGATGKVQLAFGALVTIGLILS
jgi:1,4-dihydroxy-2-naphthoate polyprenyltransferase